MGENKAIDMSELFSHFIRNKDPIGRFRSTAGLIGAFVSIVCLGMLVVYQYSNYMTAIKIQRAFTNQFQDKLLSRLSDFEAKAKGLQAMLQVLNEKDQLAKNSHFYVRSSMVWSDLPQLLANNNNLFSQINEKGTIAQDTISMQTKSKADEAIDYASNQSLLRVKQPKASDASIKKPELELITPLWHSLSELTSNEIKPPQKLGLLHLQLDANELQETVQLLQDTTKFSVRVRFTDASENQYLVQSDKFSLADASFFHPAFPQLTRDLAVYGGNLTLELRPTEDTYRIAGFGTLAMCLKITACFVAGLLSWLLLSYIFYRAFIRHRLHLLHQLENTNKQLQHQTQKLDASLKNSEDFIGVLGHEIRNPLSTLRYIQAELESMELNEDAHKLLGIQKSALHTALDTLNNTLDLKKMELSALQLEFIEFEPLLIVEEIRGLIAVQCRNKRIALLINLDPTIPLLIKGDPLRLKQVLLNLLNNAVKFTRTGGIIELEIRNNAVTGTYVALDFKIIDSGDGIEPRMISKLLEPYQQADSSIARQYGGTGLGLNIASRIVQLMGGSLQIESTLGIGSKFSFTLVFETSQFQRKSLKKAEDFDKDRRVSDLQKQFDPATEKLTLVYVDDSDFNLQIAEELTKRTAHQLFLFSSPSEALQFLKETSKKVDVILSDVNMPEMNGLRFAQRVRTLKTSSRVFMAAMTASSDEEILLMNTHDFDCILTKPFDLVRVVNAHHEFRSRQNLICI